MAALTFDQLPTEVGYIRNEVADIKRLLLRLSEQSDLRHPQRQRSRRLNLEQLIEYLWDQYSLRAATATVYGWVNRNELPYEKDGKYLSFEPDKIDIWMAERIKNPAATKQQALDTLSQLPRKGGRPLKAKR